jgi:hypothetical protein
VQGPPWRDFGRPSGGHFTHRNHPADTAVNLHEISAAEYLAYNHQMSLGERFDDSKIAIDIHPEPDPPATPLSPTWQRRRISTQETSTESFHSPWPRLLHLQQGNRLYRTVRRTMLPTSTSNIGLQVTVKAGLALSLTTVQIEELQVMMFGSLTAQDNKFMCKALTTIKLLIFSLLQLEPW